MIVGASSDVGTTGRSVLPSGIAGSVGAIGAETTTKSDIEANPAYFRSISSISYGSLAGAYKAIRSMNDAMTLDGALGPRQEPVVPAILSGAGIPAALRAYEESFGENG